MMAKGSMATERVAVIIAALRENGPMSIGALSKATGWSKETVRSQLVRTTETFEQVSAMRASGSGTIPALFYLTSAALGMSEDDADRQTDDRFRDFNWWPVADQVIISAMRAMVEKRV
jgi:lambda repressor-like predicted transcriptional regulator